MIFSNPSGAPELACDQCGCRWFDRMAGNVCYECGAAVTPENLAEIEAALAAFAAAKAAAATTSPGASQPPRR
jgi:DNA-directed RNA polymerase subunit RPC12/RpoP